MDALPGPDRTSAPLYARVTARLMAYSVDCALLFGGLLVWQAALYKVNPVVAIMRRGHQPTGGQLHRWVFATATLPFLGHIIWRGLLQTSSSAMVLSSD